MRDSTNRTAGAVIHPEGAEWAAFLYEEVAPERKREMAGHLLQCAACGEQVAAWRAGMSALDQWKLPAARKAVLRTQPVLGNWFSALKWAAAAALVLGVGFGLGRQMSPSAAEVASLKASVAQLAESVQRDHSSILSNGVSLATAAANAQTVTLLTEYAQLQETQRATDQQNLARALRNFETRLGRFRAEMETLAVNTEDGFEQTHENLTRLASFSVPAKDGSLKPNHK